MEKLIKFSYRNIDDLANILIYDTLVEIKSIKRAIQLNYNESSCEIDLSFIDEFRNFLISCLKEKSIYVSTYINPFLNTRRKFLVYVTIAVIYNNAKFIVDSAPSIVIRKYKRYFVSKKISKNKQKIAEIVITGAYERFLAKKKHYHLRKKYKNIEFPEYKRNYFWNYAFLHYRMAFKYRKFLIVPGEFSTLISGEGWFVLVDKNFSEESCKNKELIIEEINKELRRKYSATLDTPNFMECVKRHEILEEL